MTSSFADVEPSILFGICLNASISVLLGLIILNWTLTFWKLTTLRVEACLARRPAFVLFLGVVICIGTILRLPILGCFVYNGIGSFKGSEYIVDVSLHCTTLSIPFILVFRAWLVYFDMKFSEALQDQKWTHHIDTTLERKNWFIENKRNYGNPKYVATALIMIWSVYAIIGTTIHRYRVISIILSTFTSVTLLSILSYQLPKFDDIWRLREETIKLCITWSIMVVFFFSLRLFLNQKQRTTEQNIMTAFHIVLISIPSYFTFFWVFRRFKLPFCICSVRQYSELDAAERNNLSKQLSAYIDNNSIEMSELVFSQLFSDEAWFKLFARHLLREFAIENLLFVLETHQFVAFLNELDGARRPVSDSTVTRNCYDEFPATAPQSTIVANLKTEMEQSTEADVKFNRKCTAAVKIFLKYVPEDATFSVNLSYAVRYDLYQTFGYLQFDKEQQMVQKMCAANATHKAVQNIFDDARSEVFELMRYPFYRFKQTEAYKTRLRI